jgi:surfactin synthase thioesterase subunit
MTFKTASTGEWVRRFHPSDTSEARLVCFPHAGGSASYYYPMSEALAPGTETLAIQYPGRQDRRAEPCIENLDELADEAFAALRGWADKPLVFFGHSLGSILAYEVAARFQRSAGAPPAWLIASGYPAPSRLRGGDVHRRDDAGLIDVLRSSGGTDEHWLADQDLMASVLPAVRGDYRAIETHRPAPGVLNCPITMLVGDADPQATLEEAQAWRAHTSSEFELRVFPGGHFYLNDRSQEVVETVSRTVKCALR